MQAKFIGKNRSCGFIHGNVYDLEVIPKMVHMGGVLVSRICVQDKHSKAWCPYSDGDKLLQNWHIIQE